MINIYTSSSFAAAAAGARQGIPAGGGGGGPAGGGGGDIDIYMRAPISGKKQGAIIKEIKDYNTIKSIRNYLVEPEEYHITLNTHTVNTKGIRDVIFGKATRARLEEIRGKEAALQKAKTQMCEALKNLQDVVFNITSYNPNMGSFGALILNPNKESAYLPKIPHISVVKYEDQEKLSGKKGRENVVISEKLKTMGITIRKICIDKVKGEEIACVDKEECKKLRPDLF